MPSHVLARVSWSPCAARDHEAEHKRQEHTRYGRGRMDVIERNQQDIRAQG
jgi:hypothetical protein